MFDFLHCQRRVSIALVSAPARQISVVDALSKVDAPEPGDGREYLEPLGLTNEDIPVLVELVQRWAHEAHFEATVPDSAMWAPVHAWRALGELRAEIVVPTLLVLLDTLDRRGDEWMLEEFPSLCRRIGEPALDDLAGYLLDAGHTEYGRVAVAHGLQAIAAADADLRDRVCETLADVLRPLSAQHPDLNGFVITYLADLVAVEHAELIERAFEEGVVNGTICGDWRRIAFELGIGPPPPRRRSMLDTMPNDQPPPPVAARPCRPKPNKAARKRQRHARKKNRR